MAVQRIGGSRVYVITGSNKDARLTSSGQSWANLVTSQKYKMYAEAQKATLMDIKDTERRYQEELKINAQIRKDINAEIDDKQKLKDKYMLEGAKSAQKIKEKKALIDAGIGVGGSSGSRGYTDKVMTDYELQQKYLSKAGQQKRETLQALKAVESYNSNIDKEIVKLSASGMATVNALKISELEGKKKLSSSEESDAEAARQAWVDIRELNDDTRPAWAEKRRSTSTRVEGTAGTSKDYPDYVAPDALALDTSEIDRFIAAKRKELEELGRPKLPPPVDFLGRTRGTYDDKFGTARTRSSYEQLARQAELEALGVSEQEYNNITHFEGRKPPKLGEVYRDGTNDSYASDISDYWKDYEEEEPALVNDGVQIATSNDGSQEPWLNTEGRTYDDDFETSHRQDGTLLQQNFPGRYPGIEVSRPEYALGKSERNIPAEIQPTLANIQDAGTPLYTPEYERAASAAEYVSQLPDATALPQQSMYPPTQQMRGPNLTPMRNRDLEMQALGFKPFEEMERVDPIERDDVHIPASAEEGAYNLRAIRDPNSNAVVKYVKFYGDEPTDDSFVYQVGEGRVRYFGDNSATEVARIYKRAKAAQSMSVQPIELDGDVYEFPEEQESVKLPYEVQYKQRVISDASKYDTKKVTRMTSGVMLPWQKLVVDLYPIDNANSQARKDVLLKNAWDQITIQYSGRKATMEKAHTLLLAIDRTEQQKTTIGE